MNGADARGGQAAAQSTQQPSPPSSPQACTSNQQADIQTRDCTCTCLGFRSRALKGLLQPANPPRIGWGGSQALREQRRSRLSSSPAM